MKNLFSIIGIVLFSIVNAQIINGKDISKLSPEERHNFFKTLSPEQKRDILWNFRENMLIDQLKIEKDKQETFRKIYREYQEEQKKIREIFNPKFDIDKLSDKEALEKLEKSFEVGEKHIQCRRKYTAELAKILSPQQILKIFQTEGAMKEKMMKKHEMNEPEPRD